MLRLEEVTAIRGIGPTLGAELIKAFGSWQEILSAGNDEWPQNKLLSDKLKEKIRSVAADKIEGVATLDEDEPEFIWIVKQIDRFNSRREKIAVHPGLCTKCGFDILKKNGIPTKFEDMPEVEQLKVRGALKQHMNLAHGEGDSQRNWL